MIAIAAVRVLTGWISDRESARLSTDCSQMLAKTAGVTSAGNILTINGHTLETNVAIERITQIEGKTAAGIRVTCDIDGRSVPSLDTGTVGIDSNRSASIKSALEDWTIEYGTPIVDALAGKNEKLRHRGFHVHAGPTGIRGPKPEGLGNFHERVFETVGPVLETLAPSAMHGLSIMVVGGNGRAIEGEVRLDGEPSEQLRRLVMQLDWPESATGYMLKQYYVLTAVQQ